MSRFFTMANAVILVAAVLLVVIGVRQREWVLVVVAAAFAFGAANGLRTEFSDAPQDTDEDQPISVKAAAFFGAIFGAAVGFAARIGEEPTAREWILSILGNGLFWAFMASIVVLTSSFLTARLR